MGLAAGASQPTRCELYWIPLGAGQRVVRVSGSVFETLSAARQRRARLRIYHSALIVRSAGTSFAIEMAPIPDGNGVESRGVVAEGSVGSRLLGRWRLFRYEVRCWPDGTIPDLPYAIASPLLLSVDEGVVHDIIEILPSVPTPVWGRDELRLGEMWNSNSVISWALASAGVKGLAGLLPPGGRAPGWDAGLRAFEDGLAGRTSPVAKK